MTRAADFGAIRRATDFGTLSQLCHDVLELYGHATYPRAPERLQRMVEWLIPRRPDLRLDSLGVEPLAPTGVPVPTSSGAIGFVRAARREEPSHPDLEPVIEALSTTFPRFQSALSGCSLARQEAGPHGHSVGLSATLALLELILDIEHPQDLIATGSLQHSGGAFAFAPAEAGSSAEKLRAAAEWGYRRFLVVHGQADLDHTPAGLEVVEISKELPRALLQLVQLLGSSVPREGILHAMQTYADAVIAPERCPRISEIRGLIAGLEMHQDPVVRLLSLDLCGRAGLHNGSPEAIALMGEAAELRAQLVEDGHLPPGRIGFDLCYDLPAATGIAAIDSGAWDGDVPPWPEIDVLVRELSDLSVRPLELTFCELRLRNTRARRLLYSGRISEDVALLQRAAHDLLALSGQWETLFPQLARLGYPERVNDLSRQQNQAVEALCSIAALTGSLPDELSRDHWWMADRSAPIDRDLSAFDGLYFLRYWNALGHLPDATAERLQPARELRGHPHDQIREELVLGGHPCAGEEAARLDALLGEDDAFPEGILGLVRLRSWAVVQLHHCGAMTWAPGPLPGPVRGTPGIERIGRALLQPLADVWNEAAAEVRMRELRRLVRRCPY